MQTATGQDFYEAKRKKLGNKRYGEIADSQMKAMHAINARTAQLKMSGRVVYPDLILWPIHYYTKADMADILVDHQVITWEEETVPAFRWWLAQHDRRTLDGVVFEPDPAEAKRIADRKLNLFGGFATMPAKGGSYAMLREHMVENVCSGNTSHLDYLMKWCAHLVQRPGVKIGVAPVLIGEKGCGKSTVSWVLAQLIGERYCPLVDHQDQLVGKFNAHLANALLVRVEEAFFARDKQNEARLKNMITGERLMVERKGVDVEEQSSKANFIFTSNSEHVIPATRDERRFFVLNVGNKRAQDKAYFIAMKEQLAAGGFGALMADLFAMDLTGFDVARAPMTRALAAQIRVGLPDLDRWWLDTLTRGTLPFITTPAGTTADDHVWPEASAWEVDASAVYASAQQAAGRHAIPSAPSTGRFVADVCPEAARGKRSAGLVRVPTFRLPSLTAARAAFDRARAGLGLAECWDDGTADLRAPANDDALAA